MPCLDTQIKNSSQEFHEKTDFNTENGTLKIWQKCTYNWTIDVEKIMAQEVRFCESPEFSVDEDTSCVWQILCRASNISSDLGRLFSLFIFLTSSPRTNNPTKYLLIIRDHEDHILKRIGGEFNFCAENSRIRGFQRCLKQSDLTSHRENCTITVNVSLSTKIYEFDDNYDFECGKNFLQTKFISNLGDFLQEGKFSDVIIRSGATEIFAHRAILAARSPVFSAMFVHDTLEKNLGFIKISDVDPEILRSFLYYIYTFKIEILDVDMAIKLLLVSEKYDVADLKLECEKYINKNLDITNVLNILFVADMYSATNLKRKSFLYILQNLRNICNLDEFEAIEKKKPWLLRELLVEMAKQNSFGDTIV